MPPHDRMFRHQHAHKLEEPDRLAWLPPGDLVLGLGLQPGMHVADIGAGTGYFAIPVARAIGPSGKVCAVDVQAEMLEKLRAKLSSDLPIALVHGEATRTTLGEASQDRVLYANVWHELDDRRAVLAEARRILRPKGWIAILDWRPDVEQPPGPRLAHRLSPGEVEGELRKDGWVVEAAKELGRYSYFVVAKRN